MLGKIIDVLKNAVPIVASLVGGDTAGKAAAAIVGLAEKVTGKQGDAAAAAIAADPVLAAQFKQALMEQETEFFKLRLEDVRDARARDIEVRKISRSNVRADILASISISGLIAVIVLLFYVQLEPGTARDALLILLGTLGAIVKDVYGFEFGSSRGSQEKSDLLAGQMNK